MARLTIRKIRRSGGLSLISFSSFWELVIRAELSSVGQFGNY